MRFFLLGTGAVYVAAVLLLTIGLKIAARRFKHSLERTDSTESMLPRCAIVVAAHNEAENLQTLLQALDAQEYPQGILQIVIVDESSTDNTPQILTDFNPHRHEFNTIRIDTDSSAGSPKKEALTAGIKMTDAPYLLLTDADTLPPPTWAASMSGALAGGCPVVAGYSPTGPERGFLGWISRMWHLGTAALAGGFIGLGYPVHVTGRNWGFKRTLYEKAGGYSGLESALSGDDTLLAQKFSRIAVSGHWGFTLTPDTHVLTSPPSDWSEFLRQQSRHVATGKRFRPRAFLFATAGFLLFTVFWTALITLPWNPWSSYAVIILLAKVITDSIFLSLTAWETQEKEIIITAPLFTVLHLLIFPILQIAGTVLPFRWKGRTGR